MSTASLSAMQARPSAAGAVRRLRNMTGLILAVFVTAHFLNHALGVFSIEVQQAVLDVLRPIWQSPLGTLTLGLEAGFLAYFRFVSDSRAGFRLLFGASNGPPNRFSSLSRPSRKTRWLRTEAWISFVLLLRL